MHDSLASGRKLRLLTVIDVFAKESLKIVVDTSLNGKSVISTLDEIIEQRGK